MKLGFREIGWVSENVITKSFDGVLWFLLSIHVYASCRHEF